MKNPNKPLIIVAAAVLLFAVTPVSAQEDNPVSYKIALGAITGLIAPNSSGTLKNADISGFNAGILVDRKLNEKTSLWVGFTFQHRKIGNYENQITYTSNWMYGPESDIINLKTQISQNGIAIPIIYNYHVQKVCFGAGLELSYVLTTTFNQEVVGVYNQPSKYPNAYDDYNALLHYVLDASNDNNAPFSKSNFKPVINIGYQHNNKLGVNALCAYDLFQAPHFLDTKFDKYNLLTVNLLLTLKL